MEDGILAEDSAHLVGRQSVEGESLIVLLSLEIDVSDVEEGKDEVNA